MGLEWPFILGLDDARGAGQRRVERALLHFDLARRHRCAADVIVDPARSGKDGGLSDHVTLNRSAARIASHSLAATTARKPAVGSRG